jgi:hypothetical protein
MEMRERGTLIACTAAIVVTLTVCTAVIWREVRYLTPPTDSTSNLERIEALDRSINEHLRCIDYRLMNAEDKLSYLRLHPGPDSAC